MIIIKYVLLKKIFNNQFQLMPNELFLMNVAKSTLLVESNYHANFTIQKL